MQSLVLLPLMQDWEYDRTQLTFLRELGEGQFGKVLLMQAKVSFLAHVHTVVSVCSVHVFVYVCVLV